MDEELISDTDSVEDIEVDMAGKSSAVRVLEAQMIFYHEKAEGLVAEIIHKMKELRARPEVLATMYKEFQKCAEHARECASKLAPYQSPRLESVETKSKVEHKFVIRAPMKIIDSQEWLEHAKKEQELIELEAEEKTKSNGITEVTANGVIQSST